MYIPLKLIIKNILSWEYVEFEFRQGKAVMVVGQNRDNPGQKGNGSGKSGLTEGAVIAITGTVVRPIKNKEIVRRGCSEGEVELILTNTMYRCELSIWRKLYSGTKSAEYRMTQNGEDMCENYSDLNGFNAEIWKMLGISKEDFFEFYVLEKTTVPFLLKGDTEKKKVVNRFSGANKVDNALPEVEKDVAEKNKLVVAIDSQIIALKGKQELLSDQITAEEEKYSKSKIEEQIVSIDNDIAVYESDLKENYEARIEYEKTIADKEKELRKLKATDFSKERLALNKQIEDVDKKIKAYEGEITEIKGRKNEALQIKTEYTNSLAGLIECPKCDHKFLLEDKEFDAEVGEKELKELTEEILPEIEEELKTTSAHLDGLNKQKEEIQKSKRELQTKEDEEATVKRKINLAINEAQRLLNSENKTIEQFESAIRKLQTEKETLNGGQSDKLEQLNEQLLEYIDQETELRDKLQVAVDAKADCEKWLTHFKSFKSHLANKSIANIQDYTNLYLQAMGSDIQIELEGYKVLANKKLKEEITTLVRRGGIDEASYGTYSGGERGRIDICCIVAIQTLINLNSTTGGLDLLILDEVMDSVDSLGLENIIGALQNIDRTIMIVSQNEINSLSDYTITIRKQNRISSIV